MSITAAHNDDFPTNFTIRKSRGTLASPAALITNDRLGSILFNSFDGTNFINSASIQARVTGTVSAGNIPTSLRFFVNDTVGDETEAVRIDENANLRVFKSILCTAPDTINNFSNLRLFNHHESAVSPCSFSLSRGRGTFDNPSTVLTGDPIYDIRFNAYDGSNFTNAAAIRGTVDDTVSAGVVPGRLDFNVWDSSGVRVLVTQINARKSVFNNMLQLPTFADETAADIAIGGAGNRVNGMMYYDTAVGAVRAVVAGAWASL